MRRHKKHNDKRQYKRTHGPLAVKKLQPQIRQSKQPPKQRHRPVKVMIRNRMQPARALQKRKIMRDKPQPKQKRSKPPRNLLASIQKAEIERQASRVRNNRQYEKQVFHGPHKPTFPLSERTNTT